MSFIRYYRLVKKFLSHRFIAAIYVFVCIYVLFIYYRPIEVVTDHSSIKSSANGGFCNFKPSTDYFILHYEPSASLERKSTADRVEPTIERIRTLLEIVRSKEEKYQSLLETFDIFNMENPGTSLKAYTDESNIDEIKMTYNRYIKLMPDGKTIQVEKTLIDYLKAVSSYLLDGLRKKRTDTFYVQCQRQPVFVLACNAGFFDILQGAIRTLDTHWPNHRIVFYDMGLSESQRGLLETKCPRCTIINFPFAEIEKIAPHIRTLKNYAFKPFVIQDALRRYGTIIYGDASARFNNQSFNPVLADNYIRGFAARELPAHYLPCYTRSNTFAWFNQSHTQYDNIYMAEANFLAVTDTFLTRLIIKAWLTCALDSDCLIAEQSRPICSRPSMDKHRFDQSAMVIILTHFFYQGDLSAWRNGEVNEPAPYDMYTSVQNNLGDINRGAAEMDYLARKTNS